MKIAIYVSSLKGGGAERVMLNLAEGLQTQNHSVDLLLARHEGDYLKQLPDNLSVIPLKHTSRLSGFFTALRHSPLGFKLLSSLKLPRFLTLLPAVKTYIEQNKPDAIICALHNCNLSAVLAKSCTKSNVCIIVSEHIALSSFIQSVPERETKLIPFIKLLYPLANGIVTVSNGVKNDLSDITGIPKEKITLIYNPVITPGMQKKISAPVEHPWLLSDEFYTLLAAGRLTKQKDYITLINAIELIKDQIPLKLIVLGEGTERENLTELISKKGLSDIIDLHGFADNPFAYMAHADLFVLSSALEGLSLVLLEALASGCEVISTDCPYGPSEVLQNGKYGTLVPIKNPAELAKAIKNAYEKKCLNENGMQYARQFTVEKATSEYLDLINNC